MAGRTRWFGGGRGWETGTNLFCLGMRGACAAPLLIWAHINSAVHADQPWSPSGAWLCSPAFLQPNTMRPGGALGRVLVAGLRRQPQVTIWPIGEGDAGLGLLSGITASHKSSFRLGNWQAQMWDLLEGDRHTSNMCFRAKRSLQVNLSLTNLTGSLKCLLAPQGWAI